MKKILSAFYLYSVGLSLFTSFGQAMESHPLPSPQNPIDIPVRKILETLKERAENLKQSDLEKYKKSTQTDPKDVSIKDLYAFQEKFPETNLQEILFSYKAFWKHSVMDEIKKFFYERFLHFFREYQSTEDFNRYRKNITFPRNQIGGESLIYYCLGNEKKVFDSYPCGQYFLKLAQQNDKRSLDCNRYKYCYFNKCFYLVQKIRSFFLSINGDNIACISKYDYNIYNLIKEKKLDFVELNIIISQGFIDDQVSQYQFGVGNIKTYSPYSMPEIELSLDVIAFLRAYTTSYVMQKFYGNDNKIVRGYDVEVGENCQLWGMLKNLLPFEKIKKCIEGWILNGTNEIISSPYWDPIEKRYIIVFFHNVDLKYNLSSFHKGGGIGNLKPVSYYENSTTTVKKRTARRKKNLGNEESDDQPNPKGPEGINLQPDQEGSRSFTTSSQQPYPKKKKTPKNPSQISSQQEEHKNNDDFFLGLNCEEGPDNGNPKSDATANSQLLKVRL